MFFIFLCREIIILGGVPAKHARDGTHNGKNEKEIVEERRNGKLKNRSRKRKIRGVVLEVHINKGNEQVKAFLQDHGALACISEKSCQGICVKI